MREAFRDSCPSLDRLTALFDQQLAAADSQVLQKHIQSCATCKAEWEMLVDFNTASPQPDEVEHVDRIVRSLKESRKPVRRSWFALPWVPKFAGALALLVVSVAIGVEWRARKAPDLSAGESGVLRSAARIEITPRGDLRTLPAEFSWNALPGAVSYEIVVSEVDGTVVWQGRTEAAVLPLPDAVRASLQPAKTLNWRVSALGQNGSRIAQSDQVQIAYKP